jgi:hypothetical protein
MRSRKPLVALSLMLSMGACSMIPVQDQARSIELYWATPDLSGCEFKGEVVGSQGSWYDFWLTSNPDLTHGALNDLKNAARERGANVVTIFKFQDFATSVTFLGQAYDCPQENLRETR